MPCMTVESIRQFVSVSIRRISSQQMYKHCIAYDQCYAAHGFHSELYAKVTLNIAILSDLDIRGAYGHQLH